MIDLLWLVFDALLVLILLGLAWASCQTSDLKRAVTLFIAFGVFLALTWARLRAPDLALAEAIIGAGISGALLLIALRDYCNNHAKKRSILAMWSINLLTLTLVLVMSWAMWQGLPLADSIRLTDAVAQHLNQSGVSNPVTAVLLNFRAYDTLLELAVVLTAVLTVLSLGPIRSGYQPAGTLLAGMLRWLVPLLVMTSGYLLWVGAHAPGGAFQAGAVLAAAVILIHQGQISAISSISLSWLRWILVAGIVVFLAVGVAMLMLNESFLGYIPALSGTLILAIEAAATFSIAAALSLAYLGGRPQGWEQSATATKETAL